MTHPSTPLFDYLKIYILESDIALRTITGYRKSVRSLEQFRPGVSIGDVTDELISQWVEWVEETRTPKTAESYRGVIRLLWKHAHMTGATDQGSSLVGRQPVPDVDGELPERAEPIRFTEKTRPLEYVEIYRREHDISPASVLQYQTAAKVFERFAPDVPISALNDDVANAWLVWLESSGTRGKRSIASYRGLLLALWRDAYENDRCDCSPRKVKRIKLPQTIPEAWSEKEMKILLSAADKQAGYFRTAWISRRLWWRCFVLVTWDSALRLSDVLSLQRSDIQADGLLTIVQQKTGWVQQCQLRPETLEAIHAVRSKTDGNVLPRWGQKHSICNAFKKLATSVGLKGTSKWIRRSSATAVEAIQPGAATRHLGHRKPDMAYRHYIDPTKVPLDRPVPPPIVPDINGPADTP